VHVPIGVEIENEPTPNIISPKRDRSARIEKGEIIKNEEPEMDFISVSN